MSAGINRRAIVYLTAAGQVGLPRSENLGPARGMATVLKVRDPLAVHGDPGWYYAPAGTIATNAATADLKRNGIDPDAPMAPSKDVAFFKGDG